ncbi:hypothetical protein B0H12DRAFT_1151763 [Mycena haematopus]|nr:hypothetical protein B0H12DRAFT_1151763 [Mycena haematopus]
MPKFSSPKASQSQTPPRSTPTRTPTRTPQRYPRGWNQAGPVYLPGELATPNGPSIKRTEATKRYKITAANLDTITPILRQANPMGGAPMQTYNEVDVRALAERVRPGKPLPEPATPMGSSSGDPSPALAPREGPKILRTAAMNEYNLSSQQMDQILPISATPNIHGSITRYYNVCDVEASTNRHC